MISDKKEVFSFRTLIQKIRNYFKLEYEYWWNDFRDIKYYEDFGIAPPTFQEKWRNLKYKIAGSLRLRKWLFKESFKWHVKCYLVFWKLPTLLRHSIDGFIASESYRDLNWENKDVIAEPFMDEIVDSIWESYLAEFKEDVSQLTAKDKEPIHKAIKEKYEQFELRCPDEYLTEKEIWDKAEEGYENSRLALPGGPDYDERPSTIDRAEALLKKHNFRSRYSIRIYERDPEYDKLCGGR